MSEITNEDLLNFEGGISMDDLDAPKKGSINFSTELPEVTPMPQATPPLPQPSIDSVKLRQSINSIFEEDAIGGTPAQAPSRIDNLDTFVPQGDTPLDRFKDFIENEKRIDPTFDFTKDLDDMIEFLIAEEELKRKYSKFTRNRNDDDEIYRG